MKRLLLSIVALGMSYSFTYGQNTTPKEDLPLYKKTQWQYDVGLGYLSTDLSALNSVLRSNNYRSDFSGNLIHLNYGFRAVFFEKFSLGLQAGSGFSFDFNRNKTSFATTKAETSLKVGYDIWSTNKYNISIFYQPGMDLSSISLIDNPTSGVDFNVALNNRSSQNLQSTNFFHRFLVRYDFLFKQRSTIKGIHTPALGFEVGYTLAGKNTWENNLLNGPSINNSGLFINLVYAARFKRFVTTKSLK